MTRIESELLDLAESISRNDDTASAEDYQTLYGLATDAGEIETENARLREENKSLRKVAVEYYTELSNVDNALCQIMAKKKLKELGIEV